MSASVIGHETVVRNEFAYSSHPHIVRTGSGELLVVFNQAPRRSGPALHPPEDPLFRNFLVWSSDEARTWSAPRVVPGYDFSGTECAALTSLRDGGLLLHQWRYRWYPYEAGVSV